MHRKIKPYCTLFYGFWSSGGGLFIMGVQCKHDTHCERNIVNRYVFYNKPGIFLIITWLNIEEHIQTKNKLNKQNQISSWFSSYFIQEQLLNNRIIHYSNILLLSGNSITMFYRGTSFRKEKKKEKGHWSSPFQKQKKKMMTKKTRD